jgi:exodeoxyribonuclease VII small subunit
MSDQGADDIGGLTYEAAVAQLDALIQKLEGGSIPLEDAIAAYERGTRLSRHCEELLDRTERRVTALMVGSDGRPAEAPLDIEPAGGDAPPPPRPRTAKPVTGGLFPPAERRPRAAPVDPDDVPF